MLTCIARAANQAEGLSDDQDNQSPNTKHSLKSITSQIKDIALKASGVYRNCSPCTGPAVTHQNPQCTESESSSSYRRTTSSNSRQWGKEMEARLKGISSSSSSGGRTPVVSASGRRDDNPVVFVEESEPKQWVAQVEPGVLITFVSMPRGGNDLKRICFSREMFNKWQAQRWWGENYEKVMELYNVQRMNRQAFPLPITSSSRIEDEGIEDEDESWKRIECGDEDCPVTPPLSKERKAKGTGMGYSSSSSINNGGTKMVESLSSIDASVRTSSSEAADADGSGEVVRVSNNVEKEWVEEDEAGVYITIRALPGGGKELKRVRFSREKFGEMHARLWWEENRARVHKQYL
ncbi:protein Brevis radix-like 4 isoform X2 [Impatiens glandulifera]|uniref:protein Brevis radix-like 4 isoform X2 n=1 Tax=Impatiens glandulifera TaxID=253017 RepID=UPI001FB19D14|nr:protein Brevis radix-like 4 isoform X2 [Impatiens glandulifera]